ncbi:MAG: hypothetical protein JWM09_177 [Francisellaceae bacterium]|nr:hypothetical protein [Francisellaceae bacterium]
MLIKNLNQSKYNTSFKLILKKLNTNQLYYLCKQTNLEQESPLQTLFAMGFTSKIMQICHPLLNCQINKLCSLSNSSGNSFWFQLLYKRKGKQFVHLIKNFNKRYLELLNQLVNASQQTLLQLGAQQKMDKVILRLLSQCHPCEKYLLMIRQDIFLNFPLLESITSYNHEIIIHLIENIPKNLLKNSILQENIFGITPIAAALSKQNHLVLHSLLAGFNNQELYEIVTTPNTNGKPFFFYIIEHYDIKTFNRYISPLISTYQEDLIRVKDHEGRTFLHLFPLVSFARACP